MKTGLLTIVLLSLLVMVETGLSAQEHTHYGNRIQRYGHGFSEPNDFTPEEYEYIAKNYSIFTVEKRHAWGDYGPNT